VVRDNIVKSTGRIDDPLTIGEVPIPIVNSLELIPSIATIASENSFRSLHRTMNSRHTPRIACPSFLRKSAIVLKSGVSRAV
jgi:hypothetical protein